MQLEIDMKDEIIILANTTKTELKDLPRRSPKDSARYHFFLWEDSHEGDDLKSVVSIYSMLGYTCSKENGSCILAARALCLKLLKDNYKWM